MLLLGSNRGWLDYEPSTSIRICQEITSSMKVYLVNPSSVSFGTAVITPRWLYVLAGATPKSLGNPVVVDETLESLDITQIQPDWPCGCQSQSHHSKVLMMVCLAAGAVLIF
jgi:hypothetical protein